MNLLKGIKCGFWGVFVTLLVFGMLPAVAQSDDLEGISEIQKSENVLPDPDLYAGIETAYKLNLKLRQPEVKARELSTMFFTLWQHRLLQEAKRVFRTRRPENHELNKEGALSENRIRGIRELTLGGIVFSSAERWIIWLNGQRVTPEALPKQIMDIRVSGDYIELKWFDTFTNLVYPIRLRPHQRFNLDTRIFLPGASTL